MRHRSDRTRFRRTTSGERWNTQALSGEPVGKPTPRRIISAPPVQLGGFSASAPSASPFAGFVSTSSGTLGPIIIFIEKVVGENPTVEIDIKSSREKAAGAKLTIPVKAGFTSITDEIVLDKGDVVMARAGTFATKAGEPGYLSGVYIGFKFIANTGEIKSVVEKNSNAGNNGKLDGDVAGPEA